MALLRHCIFTVINHSCHGNQATSLTYNMLVEAEELDQGGRADIVGQDREEGALHGEKLGKPAGGEGTKYDCVRRTSRLIEAQTMLKQENYCMGTWTHGHMGAASLIRVVGEVQELRCRRVGHLLELGGEPQSRDADELEVSPCHRDLA